MIRLGVRVARADAEIALARLLDLAPDGLEEVEHVDGTVEYALYRPARPDGSDIRAALDEVVVELTATTVADDWAERWREFHVPSLVGNRLWVRAPWEPPAAPGGGVIDIEIEPAQAFGTGSHPTTRLCLELLVSLAEQDAAGRGSLLDIGCGSGVLAIAAAKLGWMPVLALDDDPASVAATRENAAANGVAVEARQRDIRRDPVPTAPTVTANLVAPLLIELAGAMTDPPGQLIASGLAHDQADAVAVAFADRHGMREHDRRREGEWTAVLLTTEATRRRPRLSYPSAR